MSKADSEQIDPQKIETYPTKDFFISMLIRDLSLKDAIGDLVDNCVDGARSASPDDYSAFKINLEFDKTSFIISDNCGGIDINTARNYAFRFGRPSNFPSLKGSVGQFGIGMKRALFKIGKEFEIKSNAATSHFQLIVDVDQWQKQEAWEFKLNEFDENKAAKGELGTTIKVSKLNKDVITDFASPTFLNQLKVELELENTYPISKGLDIKINKIPLKKRNLEFAYSETIKPAFTNYEVDGVRVEMMAGIGDADLDDGGWYLFCNGRLVLGPEQTEKTGWTGGRGNDGAPKYHGQYNRFRGYVFFEADDASLLPWNTTKNGVDLDSALFKQARQKMIQMMKPIMGFLNKMKEERENDPSPEDLFLQKEVDKTVKLNISEIVVSKAAIEKYTTTVFNAPVRPIKVEKRVASVTITYKKPKADVDKVKKVLDAKNTRQVGEATFDYFMETEVES